MHKNNNHIKNIREVCNILTDQNQDKNYNKEIANTVKQAHTSLDQIEKGYYIIETICKNFRSNNGDKHGTIPKEIINQCRKLIKWKELN
jgi:hypothetical protein